MRFFLLLIAVAFLLPNEATAQAFSTTLTPNAFANTVCTNCTMYFPVQTVAPTTGSTVASDGSQYLVVNQTSTLLALTVNFPANPVNGQLFVIGTKSAITTLTLGGGTILGGIATLALAGWAQWVYSSSAAAWIRVG